MVNEQDLNAEIWNSYYTSLRDNYLFPNEYVVRSFLGTYPGLKMSHDFSGKKVCDISCGDGRNIVALHRFGLDVYATEISKEICEITMGKLSASDHRISADIRVGNNQELPFEANMFDYLLSWNACYYMENEASDFSKHVAEYARVSKPGAYLVCCVPAPGCFSLQGAELLENNLIRLNAGQGKWGILTGSIYRQFRSFEDIEETFGSHFENFQKCTIKDDCFGLPLEYFVFVCQRK
ncbi:class I SAM-dependent methyltransferase [Roseobacter sp. EG26]|uniref:class I SAM-dependent methyltransferase n=1 Tax=Roseobacter sp. EG26 TaxID=3412477 RepID=UPI003CE55CB9